jgi:DNA (cytosine-5)-methyltransferase 1
MGRPFRKIDSDQNDFFAREGLKVLDICCCSGVSAEGIKRPGVDVLGVDISKPSYYPGTFYQCDALDLELTFIQLFDFVWASPPCQEFSRGSIPARKAGKVYPNILPEVREMLNKSGVPAVIENVPESGVRPDFMLCGSMFGLQVMRHRHFECIHWKPVYKKMYCDHKSYNGEIHTVAGSFRGSVHDAAMSMGCYPGRLRSEIKEGIPPSYSSFIFDSFLHFHKCSAS